MRPTGRSRSWRRGCATGATARAQFGLRGGEATDSLGERGQVVAENDLVVVRLVVSATVKGTLLGVPADGQPVG